MRLLLNMRLLHLQVFLTEPAPELLILHKARDDRNRQSVQQWKFLHWTSVNFLLEHFAATQAQPSEFYSSKVMGNFLDRLIPFALELHRIQPAANCSC